MGSFPAIRSVISPDNACHLSCSKCKPIRMSCIAHRLLYLPVLKPVALKMRAGSEDANKPNMKTSQVPSKC